MQDCASAEQFAAVTHCPVCHQVVVVPRFSIGSGHFHIVDCIDCGTGRLEPMPTPDELNAFYPQEYYGTSGKKFSRLIEALIQLVLNRLSWFITRRVPDRGRILDVGCGRGVLLNRLVAQGFETFGTDINEDAVRGNDPQTDIRIISELSEAAFPDEFFDCVVVWHVLEHLIDPAGTMREIERITKPGGVLIIAVPNYSSLQAKIWGKDWFHLDPPRHLYHFSVQSLIKLVESSGFNGMKSYHFSLRQNPFGWVQSSLNRLIQAPRNTLYSLLHRHATNHGSTTKFQKSIQYAAYYFGMPVAIVASIICALLKCGATVHVVAYKQKTDDTREANS